MDIMSQFNLPGYIKGKTFAEASKAIDNRFKDRNDPESKATLNELQGRLRDAQEYIKAEQLKLSQPNKGTGVSEDNKMFLGGFLDKLGGGDPGVANQMAGAKKAMGVLGGAASLAKMAFGDDGVDTSGATAAPEVSVGGSALGGAATGAQAGMAFGPLGGAIGGVVGGIAGLIGGKKKRDAADTARFNHTAGIHKDNANRYELGGYTDSDPDPFNFEQENYNAMISSGGGIRNLDIVDLAPIDQMKDDEIFDTVMDEEELDRMKTEDNRLLAMMNGGVKPSTTMKTKGIDTSIFPKMDTEISSPYDYSSNNSNTEANFNPTELLRYAPALMNLSQLSNLKPPKPIGLAKINKKYDKQLVDEQGIQNVVRNAVASNRDAILSSTGGSGSSARANLLASHLQGTKALSEAYRQAGAENRQEGRREQEFNMNTDRFNVGQMNNETNLNLEQEAAYQTNRSKLLSQIGQDLGGVGKEELLKRFPELMGLSYDWKGKKKKKEK